ncbi:predicted protein [Pyrenophora tritici-repentis Pt-1C-BFP]|uniref:Uncharacterized protein n=1 Tax=Pyrenophora tritici-repentis (strain Pt-1C-BFP) TaxID=426418 RepID=B2WHI6_PYRTR|nr:uncharacterized protein PTRG_09445 [Pyrenophora tritici-repentis Pt-1C-BFP]EDU42496.1 predicted protein [Pyrenophora tritici-repentis Pt-1C-BFP]
MIHKIQADEVVALDTNRPVYFAHGDGNVPATERFKLYGNGEGGRADGHGSLEQQELV